MARSAVVGALRVTLGIDTAAFEAGLNRVEKQLAQVGKRMQSIGRTMSAAITAPLTLAGGTALKFAADFEAAMSRARAVLNPTQHEFKLLSDLALELGRTTRFTAAQAADGIEMLARNGLKAGHILNGAASAMLNLAQAAGADLAPTADLATDIMANFNKTSEEVVGIIDQIAGVLVNSKFDWQDYMAAVGQAAGPAGEIGMAFEDMNAALALTAPSFSSGEEAGTSFKGMLLRLAPSEKKAQKLIKDLGLEFWDAAGNLRSLADIAEELRVKLGDLTKEAQTEVLGALFGQRTIRTALRLMAEGREGVERMKAAIADVTAEQMAKDRLDNLNGALLMLKSAVEGLAIAIANSGILEWTRNLVDWLTEVTRAAIDTNPAILKLISVIGLVVAALGPVILTMGLFAAAIGAIGVPAAGITAAIIGITAAAAAFWPEIKAAAGHVAEAFARMYYAAREWLLEKLKPIFKAIGWAARQMGIELKGVFAEITAEDVAAIGRQGGPLGILRQQFAETAAASQQAARDSIGPWLTVTNRVRQSLSGTRTLATGVSDELHEIVNSPLHTLAEKMAAVEEAFRLGQIPVAQYKDMIRSLREEEFQQLHEVARATLDDIIYSPLETFTAKMQALEEALRNGTIGFREFGAMAERVQQDNMSNWDALASSAAGALTSIFGKSKGAAIAAAVINTAQAVTRNLAQYPWPFGAAMAALAAASGAAQIATIKSTNIGGGGRSPSVNGGSGGGTEPQQQALPAQTLHVAGIAPGQFFKGEAMRELVEELLQFQRDGGRVVLA